MFISLIYIVLGAVTVAAIVAIHPIIATAAYLLAISSVFDSFNALFDSFKGNATTGGSYVAGAPPILPIPAYSPTLFAVVFCIVAGIFLIINWQRYFELEQKSRSLEKYWAKFFILNLMGIAYVFITFIPTSVLIFIISVGSLFLQ